MSGSFPGRLKMALAFMLVSLQRLKLKLRSVFLEQEIQIKNRKMKITFLLTELSSEKGQTQTILPDYAIFLDGRGGYYESLFQMLKCQR